MGRNPASPQTRGHIFLAIWPPGWHRLAAGPPARIASRAEPPNRPHPPRHPVGTAPPRVTCRLYPPRHVARSARRRAAARALTSGPPARNLAKSGGYLPGPPRSTSRLAGAASLAEQRAGIATTPGRLLGAHLAAGHTGCDRPGQHADFPGRLSSAASQPGARSVRNAAIAAPISALVTALM